MGGRNHIVQCVELIETDKIYIRNLSIVIFLCSGILSRLAIFCLSTLHLCFVKLLEDINNIVCTVKLKSICLIIPSEWSKFGETGIQFFRILYFGNDQEFSARISSCSRRSEVVFSTHLPMPEVIS